MSGIRFDWDAHGCDGYAVPVQDRSHEDSGDLIAAKIHRSWNEESESSEADAGDDDEDLGEAPNRAAKKPAARAK